jgi:ParB/RepB/Spo0J family partition protein
MSNPDGAVTAELRRDVLRALLAGKSHQDIAAAHGVPVRLVADIGVEGGWPNRDSVRFMVDELAAITAPEPARTQPRGIDSTAGRLVDVPVGKLLPDPNNPRPDLGDPEDLQLLAAEIRDVGVVTPLVARRTAAGLEVTDGHRRLAAAKIAHRPTVPVVIRSRPQTPEEVLAEQLATFHRVDLDPISEAKAIRRFWHLIKAGNADQVAQRLPGRHSAQWVRDRLALLDLPPIDQERIRRGDLGVGAAKERLYELDPDRRPAPPKPKPPNRVNRTRAQRYAADGKCPTCGQHWPPTPGGERP